MSKLFLFFLLLATLSINAQDKECKFEKAKDAKTGKPLQVINASTKLGKFIMGKTGDSLYAYYSMKLLFALVADTKNMVYLRIDSVRFLFEDNTYLNVPALGSGSTPNVVKLKPQFQDINFRLIFDPSMISTFMEKKVQYMKIYGEKDAEAADALNEKQGEKFSKAFNCLKQLKEG